MVAHARNWANGQWFNKINREYEKNRTQRTCARPSGIISPLFIHIYILIGRSVVGWLVACCGGRSNIFDYIIYSLHRSRCYRFTVNSMQNFRNRTSIRTILFVFLDYRILVWKALNKFYGEVKTVTTASRLEDSVTFLVVGLLIKLSHIPSYVFNGLT